MKLAYRYEIAGRKIFVFDRFLAGQDVRAFAASLQRVGFRRTEADSAAARDTSSFSCDYDVATVENRPFVKRIRNLVVQYFPRLREPRLYRAYANLGIYGDVHVPHRDSSLGTDSVTGLYYANDKWEAPWAGETVFFNESKDSVRSISPRPGRLVIFDGTLLHRTGSVSRLCRASRFSVAIKFASAHSEAP
jgi:SM-20-related protein